MSSWFFSPTRMALIAGLSCLGVMLLGCKPTGSVESAPNTSTRTPAVADTALVPSSNSPALGPSTVDSEDVLQGKISVALEQGDFVSAVQHLERLVALKPQDEEALFNLGYAYARARQTNEAIRSYQRCLEILPTYAEAHNNLGNLLLAQKRFAAAELHFRTALTNQPENSLTYNNLGKLQAVQSRPQEGIPLFREAIRLNPQNWEARHNIAVAYLSLGMLDESRAELRLIVDENPGMLIAKKTLARVEALREQQSGARKSP